MASVVINEWRLEEALSRLDEEVSEGIHSDEEIDKRLDGLLTSYAETRLRQFESMYGAESGNEHDYLNPSDKRLSTFDDEIAMLRHLTDGLSTSRATEFALERIKMLEDCKSQEFQLFLDGRHDELIALAKNYCLPDN